MTTSASSPVTAVAQRHGLLAIARYPAQLPSLSMLVALSLSMLLTLAPLVGPTVFLLVIWAAACHYCVEVLERSANGSLIAPEFAVESDGMGWTLLILQLFFLACAAWLGMRVESASARWIGYCAIAFVQPAMVLTASMNRDMASAWNPARLARVISRLGLSYFVLVPCTIALGVVQVALDMAISQLPALLSQPLSAFVTFYLMVMYFHILGRLVHAHHRELEFIPIPESTLRPEDRHVPLLRRVDHLEAEQDFAGAAHELGRCLATEQHASAAMHARYRGLLARTGNHAGLLEHARTRIDALLVEGSEREALALLRESLAEDAQFRPGSGERTTQLARAAERQGQIDLALILLGDFPLRYPRDPDMPRNAIAASVLWSERRSDLSGARAAIDAALDCLFPAHPMHAQLLERRNQIDLLAKSLQTDSTTNGAGYG